jgi:hypothetical protein
MLPFVDLTRLSPGPNDHRPGDVPREAFVDLEREALGTMKRD